jgi:hypothetical protein
MSFYLHHSEIVYGLMISQFRDCIVSVSIVNDRKHGLAMLVKTKESLSLKRHREFQKIIANGREIY